MHKTHTLAQLYMKIQDAKVRGSSALLDFHHLYNSLLLALWLLSRFNWIKSIFVFNSDEISAAANDVRSLCCSSSR